VAGGIAEMNVIARIGFSLVIASTTVMALGCGDKPPDPNDPSLKTNIHTRPGAGGGGDTTTTIQGSQSSARGKGAPSSGKTD